MDGIFTQEDPIGLAGGLNLYGFAGGDPVNFVDPFGLRPCPPDNDCINPLKMTVGTINMVRGAAGTASGALILTAGSATAPVLGPITGPAIPVGAATVAFGLANVSRGAQQFSESLNSESGPVAKNLLGLLPFGQKYDDPGEPGMVEYFKERYKELVSDPIGTSKRLLKEFFAIEKEK